MARFIRRGVSKVRFAPTIANKAAVSRAEITSSTDLTPSIAEINGWMLEASNVATPDMGSRFDSSVPGVITANDSNLVFYEDDTTDTIETLLPAGTEGNVLLFRKGDVPASASLDVFPVRVSSKSPSYSTGNEAARFQVNFAITEEPELDTVIPAAV
jgi:hypothetical protein